MSIQTTETTRTRSAVTAAVCVSSAWDCQTHSFMGSPETVEANLAALPDALIARRVFMLAVEGDSRTEARFFERFNIEDVDGTISNWDEHDMGDLVTQITEVLTANRGVHCPGEQVKAALESEREVTVSPPEPAPKTAAEAFGPIVRAFKDDKFVHATVMVFC
jgi:hypothetical protein